MPPVPPPPPDPVVPPRPAAPPDPVALPAVPRGAAFPTRAANSARAGQAAGTGRAGRAKRSAPAARAAARRASAAGRAARGRRAAGTARATAGRIAPSLAAAPPAVVPPVGLLPPLEPAAPPAPPAPVGDPIVPEELHAADTANRTAQSARRFWEREKPVTRDDRIQNNWRCVGCIVRKGSRLFSVRRRKLPRPRSVSPTAAEQHICVASLRLDRQTGLTIDNPTAPRAAACSVRASCSKKCRYAFRCFVRRRCS